MVYRIDSAIAAPHCADVQFKQTPTRRYFDSLAPGEGLMLSEADVPSQAVLVSKHKVLPDFVKISGKISLSSHVKDLLTGIMPNISQLFPVIINRERGDVEIVGSRGLSLKMPYWVLNPMVRLDAVDLDHSKAKVEVIGRKLENRKTFVTLGPLRYEGIVFNKSLLNGYALWASVYHLPGSLFISDEFYGAINSHRLKGLLCKHLAEI